MTSLLNLSDDSVIEIDESILTEFWNDYFDNSNDPSTIWGKRIFIDYFKSHFFPEEDLNNSFFLTTKAFKITLTGNVIKSGLVASLTATLFWIYGCQDITKAALLPVLGCLFAVERIELKKSDETIIAHIPVNRKKGKFLTPEKLYDLLSEDIKEQLNFLNFTDFLERLELAGFADQKDGKYVIFTKGKNKFRINWL